MMVLLNHNMQALKRFQPESMALNLEERNSTATITVGPDAPEISINDWLRDETEPGKGIVWRVKTVTKSVETQTRTISLDHVVQYLKDYVLFGEVKPGDITGDSSATSCSARQAAGYAMNEQSLWRLGELEGSRNAPYNFNGDTVFAALETITSSLADLQWEYDLRSLPFTLHIRRQPTGFQSEMRMRRNITTMKVQIDRTRMYTRLYPIGKNNLHISGDYVSKNERTWGVVCKIVTDQSQDTEDKLRDWATERLERHCEPLVTVTVAGLELSAATGESLDHIVVGRRCRIPLPDYGTAMTERVTKMSWSDKIKEPEKVTVTLANSVEDIASIINHETTSGESSGKGGRTSATKAEEDHAWFVDTTTHVAMGAEAVAGPGSGEDWSRVAEVVVDGEGIHQRVTRTEGEVVTMWSAIEVLEDKIYLEVANAKSDTYAKIEMTASSIRSEVNSSKSTLFSVIMQTATNIYTQVGNAKSGLYSKIEQTASSIRSEVNSSKSSLWSSIMQTSTAITQKVGKGEVISCINQTAESITIQASKINLSGYVKATDIDADFIAGKIALISNVQVKRLTLTNNGYIVLPHGDGNLSLTGAVMVDVLKGVKIEAISGTNNYGLFVKTLGDSAEWTRISTFSRAVSSWIWGGGSGKINVTALPQNQTQSVNVSIDGQTSITTNGTYTYTVDYENGDGDDVSTGATKQVTVDVPAEAHTNSMSITRAGWHSTSGNVYYGKLYYWDDDDQSYSPVVNSNKYWYYSGSNKSGTTTVWY